ncbi:MAG: CHAT domain-containing protein, partial [Proteobacteria bacterium]|nr:CHAT domain-containing protein [Pseudomonadota bacterium]
IIYLKENRLEEAYTFLEESIKTLEGSRNICKVVLELNFQEKAWLIYSAMISLCLSTGRKEDAFSYLERGKQRVFLRQIKTAGIRFGNQGLEDLSDKLSQRYQENFRLSRQTDDESQKALDNIHKEINLLESEYEAKLIELFKNDPYESSLSYSKVLLEKHKKRIEELQFIINNETALLEYYYEQNIGLVIFVITKEHDLFVYTDKNVDDLLKSLSMINVLIKQGKDLPQQSLEEHLREFNYYSGKLYEQLIAPVNDYLNKNGIHNLKIVPFELLHNLPFCALYNSITGKYLIEEYIISQCPNAEIYTFLRKLHKNLNKLFIIVNPKGTLLFSVDSCYVHEFNKGNLSQELRKEFEKNDIYLSQKIAITAKNENDSWLLRDEDNQKNYYITKNGDYLCIYSDFIENAEDETMSVSKGFLGNQIRHDMHDICGREVRICKEHDASIDNFYSNGTWADVIHIIAHGVSFGNPMYSHILLCDKLGNPYYLSVSEIMTKLSGQLKGSIVILSSCESGLSLLRPGDELLGFVLAFLKAGCTTLLVSLWKVDDKATSKMMKEFYTNLRENPEFSAESLRNAILRVKEEYPTPYYWAPFIHIGV